MNVPMFSYSFSLRLSSCAGSVCGLGKDAGDLRAFSRAKPKIVAVAASGDRMRYLIPGLLILAGIINANLIRVGIETGKVQSRLFNITKDGSPSKFWLTIMAQGVVTALFFGLAVLKMGAP